MNTKQKAIKYFKKWVKKNKAKEIEDTTRRGVGFDFKVTWNNGEKRSIRSEGD